MDDAIRKYLHDRDITIAEFREVTVPSKPYRDALGQLDRETTEFVATHRALALYTTRQRRLSPRRTTGAPFLLENAVKALYVDQQRPDVSVEERVRFLVEKVPRRTGEVVDGLALPAFGPATRAELRLKRLREDRGAGFDTARELERVSKTMFQVYDIVIVLLCHGIGLSMTGDLFIQVWDEHAGWPFHKGKFTRELSRYFDYKAERKHRAT